MAQVASGGGWTTRFTVVSQDTASVSIHLEFFADNGSPLALPLSFPQTGSGATTASSLDRTLGPGASLLIDTGGGAQQVTGWAKLTTTGKATGFAIFSFPGLGWNAVVPLETSTAATHLLAFDNTGPLGTGLAIANTAATPAVVTAVINDDAGALLGNASISLPGNGHQSSLLGDAYPATKGKRGVVRLTGNSISILGLRANGPALTTLPALVVASPGNSSITHVTFNGGFTTRFTLVNTGSSPSPTSLSFFDDNGAPLSVPMLFPQSGETVTGPTITRTLAPGASLLVDTVAQDSQSAISGSAQMSAGALTSGFAIFRWTTFGQEASVPLETRNPAAFVLAFDDTGGLTTGFALQNIVSQPAAIAVLIRDDAGSILATDTLFLAAKGHTSFMLPDNYSATKNVRGTAEFDTPANGQISVVGLRAKSDGTLTTIPVLTSTATHLIAISAISKTEADPFTRLTVTGTGFDPTAAISVVFIPKNGNPPIVVPASSSTTTSVQAAAPPLLDPVTAASIASAVDIQIMQVAGTTVSTSNRLSGLAIKALLPVPQGVPSGALTAAYLTASLNISRALQTVATAKPGLSSLASVLAASDVGVRTLISGINSVVTNPDQTFTMPGANGTAITFTAADLAVSDQLVQAEVAALAGSLTAPGLLAAQLRGPLAASDCPVVSLAPVFSAQLCTATNRASDIVNNLVSDPATLKAERKLAIDVGLGLLATWACGPEALACSRVIGLESGLAGLTPFVSSFAVSGEMPEMSDAIADTGVGLFDVFVNHGSPIGTFIYDARNVWNEATKEAPPRNVLSQGMLMTYAGGSVLALPDGTRLMKVPDKQVATDSTTLLIPYVLPPGLTFNGSYGGGYSGTAIVPDPINGDQNFQVSGGVGFSVNGNSLIVGSPGPGSGHVSDTGGITIGSVNTQGATCGFSGTILLKGTGALAHGVFSCSFDGGTAAGNWSASR